MNAETQIKNEKKVIDKSTFQAAAFLTGIAGASIIGGFGMTLGMAKKKDPEMFNKGMIGARDLHHAGGALAMRALAWGTFYAVTGFSLFCLGIWKFSGASNMRLWILVAVTLVALVAPSAAEKKDEDEDRMTILDRGRFIFGTTSTTTYTNVVASTSTVFLSCLSATAATVCEKRKRSTRASLRSSRQDIDQDMTAKELETSLDPSNESDLAKTQDLANDGEEADGKLAFTVWTTSKLSTTVTVYYTNTATTVTMSFGCVAGGIILPTQNC